MPLKEVRDQLDAAAATIGAATLRPLPIADFSSMAPGSDEARALLKQWRPTLYAYFAELAPLAFDDLLAARQGPYGIWKKDFDNVNAPPKPLEALTPNQPAWTNFNEIGRHLCAMNAAACERVFEGDFVRSRQLEVTVAHAEQLRELFHALNPLKHRYRSGPAFLQAGFNTGVVTVIKFNYLCGALLFDSKTAPRAVHDVAVRSRFPSQMAALDLDQMFAASDALSLGRYLPHDPTNSSLQQFDKHAFGLLGQGKSQIVAPRIGVTRLIDPRTCKWNLHQNTYDLASGTTVAAAGADGGQSRLGCLGLVSVDGKPPVIDQYSRWVADVIQSSGASELQATETARLGPDRQIRDREAERTYLTGRPDGPSIAQIMVHERQELTPKTTSRSLDR